MSIHCMPHCSLRESGITAAQRQLCLKEKCGGLTSYILEPHMAQLRSYYWILQEKLRLGERTVSESLA